MSDQPNQPDIRRENSLPEFSTIHIKTLIAREDSKHGTLIEKDDLRKWNRAFTDPFTSLLPRTYKAGM